MVRKQAAGLCSGQLSELGLGGTIHAFLRRNPTFHAGRGRGPLILIGAGTGIAPLAGFIRANGRRPMHLFFGMRHPASDFIYREEFHLVLGQVLEGTSELEFGDAPRDGAVKIVEALNAYGAHLQHPDWAPLA